MLDPELVSYLDARFERVDQRFEKVDQRFEQIDQRFEQIDRRFDRMDQRFDRTDERNDNRFRELHVLLEHMDTKIQLVAEGVIACHESLTRFRDEVGRQFEEVKAVNRLSYVELERRLSKLER